MPCRKGMTGCRALCEHRIMVQAYRDARYAAEQLAERAPRTRFGAGDDDGVSAPMIVFRDWLVGRADYAAERYSSPPS